MSSLPKLRGSREGQGDLLLWTLPKGLCKSIYQGLQAYIFSFSENSGRGHKGLDIGNLLVFILMFAIQTELQNGVESK